MQGVKNLETILETTYTTLVQKAFSQTSHIAGEFAFHRTPAVIVTSIIIKPVSITLSFLLLACCRELGYSYFF